jgi:chromosome segregation ATPase
MDKDKPRPTISRPLTETELIENMLNIGDISEITPEPSEEA